MFWNKKKFKNGDRVLVPCGDNMKAGIVLAKIHSSAYIVAVDADPLGYMKVREYSIDVMFKYNLPWATYTIAPFTIEAGTLKRYKKLIQDERN